ncbi:hypothetical protein BSKO_03839 [Bryopsis sp. KO-2023]|nr:hypothetical protein BSKO_03839 [Bryopsis sp. KO-2023]
MNWKKERGGCKQAYSFSFFFFGKEEYVNNGLYYELDVGQCNYHVQIGALAFSGDRRLGSRTVIVFDISAESEILVVAVVVGGSWKSLQS